MNNSKVILMCGVCGSGKTTYSKKIEKEEGYYRISIDEMMWDKYGQHGVDYEISKYRELLDITDLEIRNKLIELIKIGEKNIIIDSSFWSKSKRQEYIKLILDSGCLLSNLKLIYLKADYKLLENRLKIRNQTINSNSPFIITDEILNHHFNGFEEPNQLEFNNLIIIEQKQ